MAISLVDLTEIGERFLTSMNTREFGEAASLYAADAIYESPSLVEGPHAGRIVGRDQIMGYFKEALDGDDEFRLIPLDQFAGLNMIVLLSSTIGRTFIDVLRTNDSGLIVEHLEVSPKESPIDFLAEDHQA